METTLALAILMGAGLLGAKAAQLIRLPSVTGFIVTGLLLGPSGFGLIHQELLEEHLGHFAQIALMLIAFGIGEHLDWAHLRTSIRSVGCISIGESMGACVMVALGTFVAARLTHIGPQEWGLREYICLAVLLGGVATATAPAATFHVMRELRASGPLTRTLMVVVALDDGLAIIIFGVVMAVVGTALGSGEAGLVSAVVEGLAETVVSLLIGVVCGLLVDLLVHRLKRRGEMLTAGLALILLSGELCRLMGLSPLLAGMGAGLTIVNRDRRDVRIFRTLNDFEPPLYALFFTLAGAHLHLKALVVAGVVGLAYAVLRVGGKMGGAYLGALLGKAVPAVRKYLGLALVPQAGVAIGLVFLIQSDPGLREYAAIITPVVLAGVVLSELVGPLSAKLAVLRAGEAATQERGAFPRAEATPAGDAPAGAATPWEWRPLSPRGASSETVLFGVDHGHPITALTRIATLLAHRLGARPLCARVLPEAESSAYRGSAAEDETEGMFVEAREGAAAMGYPLLTSVEFGADVVEAILRLARDQRARAIVLGHPLGPDPVGLRDVVNPVAEQADVPVIVLRLAGVLHTERILVPIRSREELSDVQWLVHALSVVPEHEITVLYVLAPDVGDVDGQEQTLREWTAACGLHEPVHCRVVPTESRLQAIVDEAASHDIVVMALDRPTALRRVVLGSLAEEVALQCGRPMLLVGGAPPAGSDA